MAKPAGKTSRAGAREKPAAPAKKNRKNPLLVEIKYLGLAAFGILLALSVFIEGAAGFIGRFFKMLLVGLFGFGAYILPFIVMAAAVYALLTNKEKLPKQAVAKAVIFFWCLLAFIHITTTRPNPEGYENIFVYIQTLYNEGGASNGGLFGALLGNLLRSLIGTAGTYTVLAATGLIAFMLLTGRSFVQLVSIAVNALRRYWGNLKDMSYSQDEEPVPYRPPSKREPRFFPDRKAKKRAGAPGIFEINEREEREKQRILLVSEELAERKPASPFHTGERRIVARKPAFIDLSSGETDGVIQFSDYVTPRDDDVLAAETHVFDDSETEGITVKGLVDSSYEKNPSASAVVPFPVRSEAPHAASISDIGLPDAGPAISFEPDYAYADYQMPPIDLLVKNQFLHPSTASRTQILENSRILEETLKSFKVEAKVVEVSVGPTVTRYDMAPGAGVKVSSIAGLSNDLALSLAAQGIRIEAPIPGKSAVGIEIPNKEPQPVFLREILEDDSFQKFPSRLAFAVGKDIAGKPVVTDVARMPHLLIAGATGSGKSVCINTLIASVLYKSRPDEVKLLMIDPKVVELSVYNGIPHLLIPVVTDPKKASGALNWAVAEMENRYSLFAETGVRDLKGYNAARADMEETELPQIVIIIDELADLMMVCKGEVEESICRLAQKARAAGIHLIVATQRPSVDVITGLIKANIPSRLAFAVSSGIDSRTVLDMYGAEKLLGKGDMLFLPMGQSKPIRLQGGFISEKEVEKLVDFLKEQTPTEYAVEMIEKVTMPGRMGPADGELDEFFHEAVDFLLEKGKASTSMLQRQFRIGYNRASRLMEDLENRGIVGPEDGVKPRKILITREEYITNYQ